MQTRIGLAGVVAACFLGLWPVAAQASTYDYTVQSGKVTLTRYNGSGGAVTIPDTYHYMPVDALGPFLFSGNGTLTSVVIPNHVRRIGRYAFYGCSNLTSAVIGTRVRIVEEQAFRHCTSLTTVTLGKRITRIGDYAFDNCSKLDGLTFPAPLVIIGTAAFMNCTSLTEVELSDRIRRVDDFAFFGCSKLTSAVIGSGIQTLGISAFNYCTSLARVSIGAGLTQVGREAFNICPDLTSLYFYGNRPTFDSSLHSTYASRPFKIYYYKGTTGWPGKVQGHRTERFTRLPTLSVLPSVRSVSHLAGTASFAVTNSGNGRLTYVASEASSWLTIKSGGTGINRGTLTVSYKTNTSPVARTGLVSVVALEATNSPVVVKIVQPARPYLLVYPWRRSVDHLEGTTTFTVLNQYAGDTMQYTVTEPETWLRIDNGATGTGSGTVTLFFAPNYSASARTGTVTVTAPGATSSPKIRKIVQAGRPRLTVTPGYRLVGYAAGQTNFAISNAGGGSMRYTGSVANVSTSWLRIASGSPGANSGTIFFAFDENPAATARTGTVNITANAGTFNSPVYANVIQSGRPWMSATPASTVVIATTGTVAFVITNRGGGMMVYTSSVTYSTASSAVLTSETGVNIGTIFLHYNFALPGQRIDVTVTAPDTLESPAVVSVQLAVASHKAASAPEASASGSVSAASEPVAVVTSDDVAPVFDSGWAAVDGNPETAWTGQKAGGGYIAVEYKPTLVLKALDVDLALHSLTDFETLYSVDGVEWKPLPEYLEKEPVSLNYLWLVFPDDGTEAVPRVLDISPNP